MVTRSVLPTACCAVFLAAAALGQTPLGSGFMYQGQLKQNGQPYNGSANLIFKLFDAASGGNLLGTQTVSNANVSGGLFAVLLNANSEFGASAFNGQGRWLEVTVNGSLLTPRQPLTAVPYASFSGAPWRTSGNDLSYTAGKVGIGTTTPSGGLHVAAEPLTNGGTLSLEGTTHTYIALFPDGAAAGRKGYLGFPGPNINNIFLANEISGGGLALVPGSGGNVEIDGKVGVDLANPSASLHVNGNIGVGVANIPVGLTSELNGGNTPILNLDVNFRHPNHNTNFVGGAIRIDARSDTADPLFQFISRPAGSTTETIIAALTRAGDFGIGTTAPNARVEIDSQSGQDALRLNGFSEPVLLFTQTGHSRQGLVLWADHFLIANDDNSGQAAVLLDDGSWAAGSDRRLKTDIASATGLLEKALALRPVEFRLKNQDLARDPQKHLGFIAQDVQPVLPSLVAGNDMLTLNYDRFGVVAIGAIQEQQATIVEQEVRIAELEAQAATNKATIESLEARVNKLEMLIGKLASPSAKSAGTE